MSKSATADDLGSYPTQVTKHPSRERSLSNALRAMTAIAVVLGFTNAASLWVLASVFPLQQVQPYLVTFSDKEQQVVRVEPVEMTADSYNVMTESEVRDFVATRHAVPATKAAIDQAWGPRSRLALRMQPKIYEAFVEANKQDLTALRAQNMVRRVEIAAVSRIGKNDWQAEFQTIDTPLVGALGLPGDMSGTPAMTEIRQNWVATLQVGYEPTRVRHSERLLNPLGFTVKNYYVTKKAGL